MDNSVFQRLMARFAKQNAQIEQPQQPKDRRRRGRAAYIRPVTILIVDDSRTVVHAISKMLRQSGFLTLEAYEGAQGVEMAKTKQPDLIIMDIVMPGINGFQATRLIRKEPSTQNIPILIISGDQQAAEELWGKRVGANDFLPKPISRNNLFPSVERWLRHLQVGQA